MTGFDKIFPDIADRSDGPPVIAFWGADQPAGESGLRVREVGWHSHRRGQFLCVETGLVRIRTVDGAWLQPPRRVGWVPPGEMHEVSISGPVTGWGAMLSPAASEGLPERACVMGANDLLRALVRKAMTFADATVLTPAQERLAAVLLDEIREAPREPLHLPMPSDARLLRMAMHLLACPQDERPFHLLASEAGISERTARRLFLAETGMGFLQWRQQARLTLAFERLARGEAIADISDALGYANPSNFIAMFRRTFGAPPARYFARLNGGEQPAF